MLIGLVFIRDINHIHSKITVARVLYKNFVSNTSNVKHYSQDPFSDHILETLQHMVTKFKVRSNKKKEHFGKLKRLIGRETKRRL
jgi:hypothetical protein